MASPENILPAVQTVQQASLPALQNFGPFTSPQVMNMKFKEFNKDFVSNLGQSISFNLPSRYSAIPGLVFTSFQATQMETRTLIVGDTSNPNNQLWTAAGVPLAFNAEELIFNVNAFMDGFGRDAVAELATKIQTNVALSIEANTYRYYGDTVSVINSYGQLANALTKFANYGAPAAMKRKVILPDTAVPDIINNGLNQFALDRNNKDAQSWQIASAMNADFYMSNLLPTHYSGTVGDEAIQLTITSITPGSDPTTSVITLSGGPISDPNSLAQYDILEFDPDNLTAGANTLLFQTFVGHIPSGQRPQVRVNFQAGSDGSGNITATVYPALIYDPTNINPNRNLTSNPLTALGGSGVHVRALPSHKCGLIMSGDAFYLGMPALPDQYPFATANEYDEVTGCSIRFSKGAVFGANTYGLIYDAIWGAILVDRYAMRLIFPLIQTT